MASAFKEYGLWPMRDVTERYSLYLVVEAFNRAVVLLHRGGGLRLSRTRLCNYIEQMHAVACL